ncbi:PTS lactose/cellobiose transporter subunit IIA [Alkalibacterium pelagium]|uniref:PTS system, cellobiose-specific IIA component n=1 Tax=Alkalibacterium pelagium TaxID=426702 RepID=A0A1H7PP82_9LACT|nr:PTS lactose/cellobiose transporter subunit IIA [Alkalibacterium pelagium]GEN51667.1 PTS cellobiose transporter subunit IIA [Alkalibacterium pelagium]SEL36847.1 PTS system, cellobiose-specific IIA component [Alkalibacterium pelagium]
MSEENRELMEVIMALIMHGGDARSSSMEAIHAAKKSQFDLAQEKLKGADSSITEAHQVQTDLLTQEAAGNSVELNLLMVHAQDTLMNAMTYRDLAEEMIDMYRRIEK